jgi:hypothetical protein
LFRTESGDRIGDRYELDAIMATFQISAKFALKLTVLFLLAIIHGTFTSPSPVTKFGLGIAFRN